MEMGKGPLKALQERGIRITPQRAHVWRVLIESGEHFTAEEIWSRASLGLPGLELSTVYRALETLGEVGLVAESRLPEGPRVFEARAAMHPHLICVVCGEISHPDPGIGERLFQMLASASDGFEVREVHVAARGVCASCSAGR
ncbi:MAG: Fur family transcriptional regulator [Rubrobacter sp.]